MNLFAHTTATASFGARIWLILILGAGSNIGTFQAMAGTEVFQNDGLLRIQLEVPADGIKSLRKDSRTYVRATVRQDTNALQNVALRLKGRTGSFRRLDDKPAFTLSFDHFVPGQRFHSLSKIHLNNSVEDASYLHERLGAELFRSAGVPAPRVSHASVELNGRRLGLYVIKEGFAPEFLSQHFVRTDGNLFEPEPGPGSDVTGPMRLSAGVSTEDESDLRLLAAAASESDLATRWTQLGKVMDADRFVSFMAMEVLSGHRDGYCLAKNNYRLYHDPTIDKFVFLPSGMDQLLGRADATLRPHTAGIVAKSVLETTEGRFAYRQRLGELFTNTFQVPRLTNMVRLWASALAPNLSRSESRALLRESENLCERIQRRAEFVARQLALPEPSRLLFLDGAAHLSDWHAVNPPEGGRLDRTKLAGQASLHIQAGPRTSASWRTKIWLEPGQYRFEARARATGVRALAFSRNNGVFLSVPGHNGRSSQPLTGDHDWTVLTVEFDLAKEDSEIELLCNMRAQAGEAWFDVESLRLLRLER